MIKKICKKIIIALSAVVISMTAVLMQPVKTYAETELKEAVQCSFVIPSEFVKGDRAGLFINRNNPMESSSVSYNVYKNGKDVKLTNREKMEKENSDETEVMDSSMELTKEHYQSLMSASYNSEYGEDVGFKTESFENIEIDGYPGYKIVSSFQAEKEETVHQTVIMILSKYKTFTITYQRAEDDECEDSFARSINSIHMR